MATQPNYDNHPLVKEVRDRLDASDQKLADATSEEKLKQFVSNSFNELLANTDSEIYKELSRKMRFGGSDGKDEPLIGTKYARWGLGVPDVEWLHDVQTSLKGQRMVDGSGLYQGPSEDLDKTFKAVSDAFYLPADEVKKIDRQAIDNLFPRIPKSFFKGPDRLLAAAGAWERTQAYQRAVREMDTAQSGFGQQLIGQQYVADLWAAARRESRIFALIDTFEMTAPTAFLPVEVDIPEMLFVAEQTADPPSNLYTNVKTGSQRVQVDAKKFIIHQVWSGEMDEDSLVPFVPFLRGQAVLALAHYSDSAAINGDTVTAGTGNINSDDAAPAANKHYLAFNGIRKVGLVDNTGNSINLGGPITVLALNIQRGRMIDATRLVDWGHPTAPDDMVYVADPETADRIALLDEITTLENLPPTSNPILTGMVAAILGHPIIGSIALSRYDVDGKFTTTTPAVNDTKGSVTAFNRRAFKVGWRRRVKLETERLAASDQTRLIYSLRMGFGRFTPTGAVSGIEAADTIYNISL